MQTPVRNGKRPEWVKLYGTKAWKRIRATQLQDEPCCRMCKRRGFLVSATVCDHITPHKGDPDLFFHGPFQSLCKTCHDSAKQAQDKGRMRGCDTSGAPHSRPDWKATR
jgi:5-methylcytosine-specific restriction protein A